MSTGIITHIQQFSVHDGPGIRTTVFLKGCQMHCPWCHNPETYRREPEIQFLPQRCIGCRACAAVCDQGAHEFVADSHVYHRDRCTACGKCPEECYARSLLQVGESRTAESVVAEVLADLPFYRPAGGVTLSGGEPLLQAGFACEILELCRQEGIHTAIETNLAWPWPVVVPLVSLVDLFLVDIKFMDDRAHRTWTGVSNRPVLDNLCRLDELNKPLVVRTPVVAGVNARPDQIGAIADFLAGLRCVCRYELLPYHPLGSGKFASLGLEGPAQEFHTPASAELDELAQRAARPGLVIAVAGATGASSGTEADATGHDAGPEPSGRPTPPAPLDGRRLDAPFS